MRDKRSIKFSDLFGGARFQQPTEQMDVGKYEATLNCPKFTNDLKNFFDLPKNGG